MVVLTWPGGEHNFALRVGELKALQEITGEGPGASLQRLYTSMQAVTMLGDWRVEDVMDTVRLGLIGGGSDRAQAAKLVREAVENTGITSLIPTACEVLLDALSEKDTTEGE